MDDKIIPPHKKGEQAADEPAMDEIDTVKHLRTSWSRQRLANGEQLTILLMHEYEFMAEWSTFSDQLLPPDHQSIPISQQKAGETVGHS